MRRRTKTGRGAAAVAGVALLAAGSLGCVDPDEHGPAWQPDATDTGGDAWDSDGEELFAGGLFQGVNGGACLVSPYNCKLRVSGGNAIKTNDPNDSDSWAVQTNVPILDGDGDTLISSTRTSAKFNYGQKRTFGGAPFVVARSTSNSSAGWFPLDAVYGKTSLAQKVGHVSAKGAGLDEMGCYEVRNGHDPSLVEKKVVYDSKSAYERAGDYLPLVRNNGLRSVNLVYNVPGMALGGPAIDHFPAGTKFRRLRVPTDHGVPSIDIPLWVEDGQGRYRKQAGTMKFIYGYVIASTGTKRNGWIAYDAVQVSEGCPGTEPDPDPVPGDAQCYARCCNGVLHGPVGVADAGACHEASKSMCADDDHVLRSELDEVEVWHRPNNCWAKCSNREAYHIVAGVTQHCTEHAASWCDQKDRGGLEDAAWSRCEP